MDFGGIAAHGFRRDGMIELPLTSVFDGLLRRCGPAPPSARPDRSHMVAGAGTRGSVQRIPLTPEGVSIADALAGIDRALQDGVRLLVFSFHSPTLEPGHTPYVRDARDRAQFDRWWDVVFDRLAERGVLPTTVADILAALDQRLA
jgi:hypothetical protein